MFFRYLYWRRIVFKQAAYLLVNSVTNLAVLNIIWIIKYISFDRKKLTIKDQNHLKEEILSSLRDRLKCEPMLMGYHLLDETTSFQPLSIHQRFKIYLYFTDFVTKI